MKRSREGFHGGNLILPELQPVTLVPTTSRLHMRLRRAYFILPIKSDSKSQKPLGWKRTPGKRSKLNTQSSRGDCRRHLRLQRSRFPTEISLNIFGAPSRESLAQPDDKFALPAGSPNGLLYLSTPQSVVVPFGPNSLLTTVISINGLPTWQPGCLATGPVCKGLQRVIFFFFFCCAAAATAEGRGRRKRRTASKPDTSCHRWITARRTVQ